MTPLTDDVLRLLDEQSREHDAKCGAYTMRLLIDEVQRARGAETFWKGTAEAKTEPVAPPDGAQAWLDEAPGRTVTFARAEGEWYEATVSRPGAGGMHSTDMATACGKDLAEAFAAARVKL